MKTKLEINEEIMLRKEPIIYIDPLFKLLNKISEIFNVSNKSYNFPKCFNYNKSNINEILYTSEDIIIIKYRLSDNLSFYFYLCLLIEENLFITNYIYNLDLIKKIYNTRKNNYLYKIINSKIIKTLIYNYKGFEIVEEENLKEAIKIEKENILLLDNNIHYLEENNINLNKNDILNGKIEVIYIKIIISLIKSDKISDFNYMNEIISSLDTENIDLTKFMYEELVKEINSKEEYFQKLKILNLNDLSNNDKINFHYFLLKYILKSSIYIYQIQFFSETRKNIIKIIKSKNFPNFENKDEFLKKRINYVIQQYLDSPYYYHMYIERKDNIRYELKTKDKKVQKGLLDSNNLNNGKRTTHYINDNTSKISEIQIVSQNSNDNYIKEEKNIQRQLLTYSNFTLYTNEKGKEPFFIIDKITVGKQKINITEFFLKMKKKKIIDTNFQKFFDFLENFKKKIKDEFKYDYCLRVKLLFQNEKEKINSIINNKDFKISCIYYFYSPIDNNEMTFKTENILAKNSTESEGFIYLIEEINNDIYKDEKSEFNESKYIVSEYNSKKLGKQKNDNISFYKANYTLTKKDIDNDNNGIPSTRMKTKIEDIINASKEQIIVYIKTIYHHKKSAKFFCQLSNGFHLSYGEENSLFIFDKNFELKVEIKNLDDTIYNVNEKKSKKSNILEIIACCNKNLNLIKINKSNLQYNVKQYQIPDITCFYCGEMNDNYYIISGESIVVGFEDLFQENKLTKSHKFIRKTYRSGININNKIAALISNSLIKNGEDCLLLCNIETNKIEKKIIGYSHIYDSNGLAVMEIGNKTILLSGCKQYFQDQNNGILLIDNPLENENNIKEKFYPTDNFEVNCICPLYEIQNNNSNDSYINNTQKKPTKFFLAGGFDSEKGEGIIQLYQVSNDNEGGISSLEYLQDIEYEYNSEFQGFEMTVTSIKQSEINGNIIISCMDGNIYLFSKPNLEFYSQENEIYI